MHEALNIDLAALINNLPGMAFRCSNDTDLTIEYASRGSIPLLGYEPGELIRNKAFRKIVHEEDQCRNKAVLNGLSIWSPKYLLIYRIRTARGEDKWVREEGQAIFSKDGGFKAIEGLLTDITDQKLIELELERENSRLKSSMGQRFRLERLIGKSDVMQEVYDLILKLAANDASVIITGESGTGKELAAHAIHALSARNQHPLIPVNCGAIPESLLEREFFGHSKGSFSGATADKPGYLDLADGGTLFLDEVGEISLNFQTKLLRSLDGIGHTPIGGRLPRTSDFRLITATNRDLKDLVRQGKMREDFFYRINVVPLEMPPLRDRSGDIPLLIEHFLENRQNQDAIRDIPPHLRMQLETYSWPGNVRELKNVIDRYLTLGKLQFADIFPSIAGNLPEEENMEEGPGLLQSVENHERKQIIKALAHCRWKKGETAGYLGITMRTLQRKLKKHDLK
ncbi:MAG: sigma 54-interacting transcriptional regulator [Desulfobacterium sp.]|nr:sigma 54-interacting transcriptional regulator [Desulfobacterium sp.]